MFTTIGSKHSSHIVTDRNWMQILSYNKLCPLKEINNYLNWKMFNWKWNMHPTFYRSIYMKLQEVFWTVLGGYVIFVLS